MARLYVHTLITTRISANDWASFEQELVVAYHERSYAFAGPTEWNAILSDIRLSPTLDMFNLHVRA